MYKKDSRLSLETRPQLVVHYISACKQVYGDAPYIHSKLFPKFSVFEDDLRERNISPKKYATTVTKLLKRFVEDKGWKYLPVNIFLSDYCIERYRNLQNTETVTVVVDDVKNILLHDEILVARVYIEKNAKSNNGYYRFCDIVKELTPLLSSEWLQVYKNKGKRPEATAIDQLCEEYNISKYVGSYFDIVSAIR